MKKRFLLSIILILMIIVFSSCGQKNEPLNQSCEHTYEIESAVESSCSKEGQIIYVCNKCGNKYTETSPKLEHKLGQEKVTKKATCSTEGEKVAICEECKEEIKTIIEKTAHKYSKEEIKKATCTEAGEIKYTCSVCGHSYIDKTALGEHSYAVVSSEKSTYASEGKTFKACTTCGKELVETTPRLSLEGMPSNAKYVTVSTVDELLNAIAPNTVICLNEGTYSLTDATNYAKGSKYYTWTSGSDGYGLVLGGIDNIAFVSANKSNTIIESGSRYVGVISLSGCKNIQFHNITIQHYKQRASADAATLYCEGCKGIQLGNCSLPGGIIGIMFYQSKDLSLSKVTINNTEWEAIEAFYSDDVEAENCTFTGNCCGSTNDKAPIRLHAVFEAKIENCTFDVSNEEALGISGDSGEIICNGIEILK